MEIAFNGKRFNIQKLTTSCGLGKNITIDVNSEIADHTYKVLNNQVDYLHSDNVVVYKFEGEYVVLLGFNTYEDALSNGKKQITAKLVNKHNISSAEAGALYVNNVLEDTTKKRNFPRVNKPRY